jgi:hypothetical protein
MVESEIFSTDFWMNDRWDKQIHKFSWLIDKFSPLEGWTADWQDPKYVREHPGLKKYPQIKKDMEKAQ